MNDDQYELSTKLVSFLLHQVDSCNFFSAKFYFQQHLHASMNKSLYRTITLILTLAPSPAPTPRGYGK